MTVVFNVHFKHYFLSAYKAILRSTLTVFNVTYSTGTREIQIMSLLGEVTRSRKTLTFVMKPVGLIRRSQVAGHRSRVAGQRLWVTDHGSGRRPRVVGRRSQVTGHGPQITAYEFNHYFVLSSWEKQNVYNLFKDRFSHYLNPNP